MSRAKSLAIAPKMIYVAAMMSGPRSVQALAAEAAIHTEFATKCCRDLEQVGWMQLIREGRRLRPAPTLPRDVEAMLASEVAKGIGMSHFKGEETTKAFADWIVAPTVRLVYDARPSFLHNRETGQNLEYDIFAPDWAWATEYQGDQHFGPTSQYPGEKQFIDRFRRDLLKANLSKQSNIRLSIVTKQDLTLDRILAVIPSDIPRRAFDPSGPFIQMLEKAGKDVAGRQDWNWDRDSI